MKMMCASIVLLAWVAMADSAPAREWTDSTGTFKVEAELVGVEDGNVQLKKENGKIITVPIKKLSKADQDYLASRANPFENGSSEGDVKSTDLAGKPTELANDDGKPAGRKSFPRGHASAFESPDGTWYLTSVRLHGCRYGYPAPPKEDFHITLCDEKFKPIADFPFPYKKFKHGSSEWVTLRVKPTAVPQKFVICADFNAERTKGVYLSHDAEGESLVGKPDQMAGQFTGGDWLLRVEIDQLKPAKNESSGE